MRFTILDRYMLAELTGPFVFGLSAFMLIFAATEILNIGKLVSNEHAPLWAALAIFAWSLPADIVLVIPMALLLGTLLAIQRLSGESELTALKAAGITFARIVAPLLEVAVPKGAVPPQAGRPIVNARTQARNFRKPIKLFLSDFSDSPEGSENLPGKKK